MNNTFYPLSPFSAETGIKKKKRQKKRKTRRRAVTAATQPRTSAVQQRRTQKKKKKKKKKNSLVLRRARSDFSRLNENTCSTRVVNLQPENLLILYNYSENQISIMSSCLERGRGDAPLERFISCRSVAPSMRRVPFGPLTAKASSKQICLLCIYTGTAAD
uniref:Uncharacterized protein n=1 Tax=Trichogramma kaykai TaxID=54128 RepID=A0ABD2WJM8_9HYME